MWHGQTFKCHGHAYDNRDQEYIRAHELFSRPIVTGSVHTKTPHESIELVNLAGMEMSHFIPYL